MKTIRYLFEYFCSPIWLYINPNDMSNVENVPVSQLPIREDLKNEIEDLDTIYQSTYNDDYPPEPKPLPLIEELSYCERVIFSAQKLKEALPEYKIVFDANPWQNRIEELNK